MALANPPPALRKPREFQEDPAKRTYFEQLEQILFQLWTRSGAGTDLVLEIGNEVDALNIGVAPFQIESAMITRLTKRVDDLEASDNGDILNTKITAVQAKVKKLINELIKTITDIKFPEFHQETLSQQEFMKKELKLLNERIEEAFDTKITPQDII